MLIIKSDKDVKKLKLGDSYVIDTFPDARERDQEVTQDMLDERNKLQLAVDEHLASDEPKKVPPGQAKKS